MLRSFRLGDCHFTHFRQKGNHGEIEEWFKVLNVYTEDEKFFRTYSEFENALKEEIKKHGIAKYLNWALNY